MDVAVAVRAGRPMWLNRRTVLGIVLVVVSVVGGRAVLEEGRQTVPVWVAAKDLAAGSPLDAGSVRIEHVRLPDHLLAAYIPATEDLRSGVVTRAVAAGELVPQNWVAEKSLGTSRALTVPVDPEHAVGGAVRPGDLVDIYATFDPGHAGARTVTLVREVEVVDVVSAGGLVMGDKALIGITISVDPAEAQRVAYASRTAALDVVRVDDPSERSSAGVVNGSDF